MNRTDELTLLSADLRRANSVITELLRNGVRVTGVDLRNQVPTIVAEPHRALARLVPDAPCYAWGHGPAGRWSRYCGLRDGIHVRWTVPDAPPPPNPDRRPARRQPRLRAVS